MTWYIVCFATRTRSVVTEAKGEGFITPYPVDMVIENRNQNLYHRSVNFH